VNHPPSTRHSAEHQDICVFEAAIGAKRAIPACPRNSGNGGIGGRKRKSARRKKGTALRTKLQIQCAGIDQPGLARISALDPANAKELFAPPLQVGLRFLHIIRRHNRNHPNPHIE
jgi:hypothetical protein